MRRVVLAVVLLTSLVASMRAMDVEKTNENLGLALFSEDGWDESVSQFSKRFKLAFEMTRVNGQPRYSAYVQWAVMGAGTQAIKVFGREKDGESRLDAIQFLFSNKGDTGGRLGKSDFEKEFKDTSKKLLKQLKDAYGYPKRKRETSSWRVDGDLFIVLENHKNEYLNLTLSRKDDADGLQHSEVRREIRGRDYRKNVQKSEFCDVLITGIPMVNQGGKGYCSPATLERCLLYYGVDDYDMHSLAEKFDTGMGGGTKTKKVLDESQRLLQRYGVRAKKQSVQLRAVKKAIDEGHPIIWNYFSAEDLERRIAENTEKRKKMDIGAWRKIVSKQRKLKVETTSGHTNLIVGYNEQSKEIALSNSWGGSDPIQWVPVDDAEKFAIGDMLVTDTPNKGKAEE